MNDPKNKTMLADGTEVRLNGKRTCPNCGDEKDMGEFGARRMEPGGVITNQSWCRTCRNPPKTGS